MTPHRNIHFLLQGQELLASLDKEAYSTANAGRSPVGAHVRHVVDYYRCFLRGLEDGRVDYDARERDPGIEADPERASAAIQDLVDRFQRLDPDGRERPLEIKVDTRADEDLVWSRSTVARELQFLVSHTVHHYALIAMQLRQQGIEPDESFGIAPSTLDYRRGQS